MPEEEDLVMEPEDGEGNTRAAAAKLKEVRDELKKAKAERDEYLESLQRMKADYINARKRFEEDIKSLSAHATERLLNALLPVLDTFDEALKHGDQASDGLSRIHAQLLSALTAHGVESFDPAGEAFSPARHESVETLAVTEKSMDNIVTKVHQKGYSLNGRVIRPARVAVGHYQG